jgi:hypothetical protein
MSRLAGLGRFADARAAVCVSIALAGGAIGVALLAFAVTTRAADVAATAKNPVALKSVSAFAGIGDQDQRAIALFQEAGKVIQSPRCMNCHPATERPTQTDDFRPHQPPVVRGDDGRGPPGGLNCTTCHHDANFDPAGVPGNPKWHLAPAEMAWQGRTLGQICAQIKDPSRNGGKDMPALIEHMSSDILVGWAWAPGAGRTPAPGTQKAFGALIKAWAAAGASCPT